MLAILICLKKPSGFQNITQPLRPRIRFLHMFTILAENRHLRLLGSLESLAISIRTMNV